MKENFNIKSGFKTPENYFDNLKGNILNINELERRLPKENCLRVPENYFEDSKQKIIKSTAKSTIKISLFWKYAVACALVLLVVSSVFVSMNWNKSFDFSDLTSFEIENYLSNSYIEGENYLILEQISGLRFDNSSINEELSTIQNIEAYLSEYDYYLDDFE